MKNNLGPLIITSIVAASAGVIIGMLLAPEKGEDLRKKAKDCLGDWAVGLSGILTDRKTTSEPAAKDSAV